MLCLGRSTQNPALRERALGDTHRGGKRWEGTEAGSLRERNRGVEDQKN